MRLFRAIGLMSGTSMDGVDVALVETDGESEVQLGPFLCQLYSDVDCAMLRRGLDGAGGIGGGQGGPCGGHWTMRGISRIATSDPAQWRRPSASSPSGISRR